MEALGSLTGLQDGPNGQLQMEQHYEYDPDLKTTVEVTPSGRFRRLGRGQTSTRFWTLGARKGELRSDRYNYKGFWNCDSCCDIEVHRRGDGSKSRPHGVATTSWHFCHNFAEHLATAMRSQVRLEARDDWIETLTRSERSSEGRLRLSALYFRWKETRSAVPGLDPNLGAILDELVPACECGGVGPDESTNGCTPNASRA